MSILFVSSSEDEDFYDAEDENSTVEEKEIIQAKAPVPIRRLSEAPHGKILDDIFLRFKISASLLQILKIIKKSFLIKHSHTHTHTQVCQFLKILKTCSFVVNLIMKYSIIHSSLQATPLDYFKAVE